jgi:hypothetical protein
LRGNGLRHSGKLKPRNKNLLVAVADQVPIGRWIMAKQQKDLRELFHDTLKDIYFAEEAA